jgi:hypothetical protein
MSNTHIPSSSNDVPANVVYTPEDGVAAFQGGTQISDSQGNWYAPGVIIVQVSGSAVSSSNPLPVTGRISLSATATLTSVAGSASSVSLLALNASRKGLYVFNESSAILYLAFAGVASLTAYTTQIAANTFFQMPIDPVYTGVISGIWGSATGNARITQFS